MTVAGAGGAIDGPSGDARKVKPASPPNNFVARYAVGVWVRLTNIFIEIRGSRRSIPRDRLSPSNRSGSSSAERRHPLAAQAVIELFVSRFSPKPKPRLVRGLDTLIPQRSRLLGSHSFL